MERVRARIRKVARSHVPVLIHGETGTGKELCAEAIVAEGSLAPFVPVNCAAFAEGVIDSELFGHERGAFTGATRTHSGLVAAADGGVLFLDELAEVSPAAQAKLLRTLESGEYRPVGSARVRHSTFRIIAATSGELDTLTADKMIRADLLHRLGALRILLPPLRERMEDIPMLAVEFLRRYRAKSPHGPDGLHPAALDILRAQEWPGNVRQLRNVVEAAAALAGTGGEVEAGHVLGVLDEGSSPMQSSAALPSLEESLRRAEQQALYLALSQADQNRQRAADLLGISEATLYRKLARHREPGTP